jgi:hypothetical protein
MKELALQFPITCFLSIYFILWEAWRLLNIRGYTKMYITARRPPVSDREVEVCKKMLPVMLLEIIYSGFAWMLIFNGISYWPFLLAGFGLLLLQMNNRSARKGGVRKWVEYQPIDAIISILVLAVPFLFAVLK